MKIEMQVGSLKIIMTPDLSMATIVRQGLNAYRPLKTLNQSPSETFIEFRNRVIVEAEKLQ